MDDIVIMCENKKIAKDILNNITKFLKDNLKLTLNSKTRIFKDIQGVNFCGYKINEKRLKIRHTSKCRMKRKLKRYNARYNNIAKKVLEFKSPNQIVEEYLCTQL